MTAKADSSNIKVTQIRSLFRTRLDSVLQDHFTNEVLLSIHFLWEPDTRDNMLSFYRDLRDPIIAQMYEEDPTCFDYFFKQTWIDGPRTELSSG